VVLQAGQAEVQHRLLSKMEIRTEDEAEHHHLNRQRNHLTQRVLLKKKKLPSLPNVFDEMAPQVLDQFIYFHLRLGS
jgi:septation ring formation regulator EzrA